MRTEVGSASKIFLVAFLTGSSETAQVNDVCDDSQRCPRLPPPLPPACPTCLLSSSLCFVPNASSRCCQAAIDRDLPMYNVNPDITVNNPQGGLWHMPGLLAKRYEAMGGRVTYFGKPHKVTSIISTCSSDKRTLAFTAANPP